MQLWKIKVLNYKNNIQDDLDDNNESEKFMKMIKKNMWNLFHQIIIRRRIFIKIIIISILLTILMTVKM